MKQIVPSGKDYHDILYMYVSISKSSCNKSEEGITKNINATYLDGYKLHLCDFKLTYLNVAL